MLFATLILAHHLFKEHIPFILKVVQERRELLPHFVHSSTHKNVDTKLL